MVVCTLEQRLKMLRDYFENHGNVAECVLKLLTDFWMREAPTALYVRCLVKKVLEETGILILYNWTFRRHHWDEFGRDDLGMTQYKVHLVQELKPIDHSMRFLFIKLTCDILTEDADFGKKLSFQMKLILILTGMQTRKIVAFGSQKSRKRTLKTGKISHRLLWILVWRHNWAFFLGKWARSSPYSQWQSLSAHVKRIFLTKIQQEDATCHTSESTFDILCPLSSDLTPLDYFQKKSYLAVPVPCIRFQKANTEFKALIARIVIIYKHTILRTNTKSYSYCYAKRPIIIRLNNNKQKLKEQLNEHTNT